MILLKAINEFCKFLRVWYWNWPSGSRDFVNVFWLFRNYLPLEKELTHHLNKLESASAEEALCQVWLKLAQWFWRNFFFYFVNVFSLFQSYLSLEKGGIPHLNKLELAEISPVVLEEKIFLILSMYFRYFVIISPWDRVGPFIWTNLNPLHPRMLCAKFGWNWPSGSGEEDKNQ